MDREEEGDMISAQQTEDGEAKGKEQTVALTSDLPSNGGVGDSATDGEKEGHTVSVRRTEDGEEKGEARTEALTLGPTSDEDGIERKGADRRTYLRQCWGGRRKGGQGWASDDHTTG